MEKELKNSLNWKEIGQRFRDLRKQHNYDQTELVKMSGRQGDVALFEAGLAPASTNYALFLRNEFGASFDWLYCGINVDIPKKDRATNKTLDPHVIGARLKSVRKEKGMTQKQFAEWIGITNQNISDYERGECKPEIKTAILIREALNKPLDWIYFGDEPIIPKSVRRANQIKSNQIKSNQIKSNQSSQESKKKSRL